MSKQLTHTTNEMQTRPPRQPPLPISPLIYDADECESCADGIACQKHMIPIEIARGGIAETALRGGEERCKDDETALMILEEAKTELNRLQRHPAWRRKAARRLKKIDRIFLRLLNEYDPNRDPSVALVLRFFIAKFAGVRLEPPIPNLASQHYLDSREGFDLAFGGLIPERTRLSVAEHFYLQNLNQTAAQDWPVFSRRLGQTRQRPLLGLASGIESLDRATNGLRGLVILAGDTNIGKSALALSLALGVMLHNPDTGVLYCSLEMSKDTIFTRLLSQVSGIPYGQLTSPLDASCESRVAEASDRLNEVLARLRVIEKRPLDSPLTLGEIKDHLAELRSYSGVQRVLLIVDPMTKIMPSMGAPSESGELIRAQTEGEADQERMRMIMSIREWTRTSKYPEGDPILAITGIRKQEPARRRLSLVDIRGRHDIVFDAECVLLLERDEYRESSRPGDTPIVVNVAKVRDAGSRGDVALSFFHPTCTFTEPSIQATSPQASVSEAKPKLARRFAGRS